MCDARIQPFPDFAIVDCENDGDHCATTHRGVIRDYAWPGSETSLTWLESDRRNFTGEFIRCPGGVDCTLPTGHPGNHNERH